MNAVAGLVRCRRRVSVHRVLYAPSRSQALTCVFDGLCVAESGSCTPAVLVESVNVSAARCAAAPKTWFGNAAWWAVVDVDLVLLTADPSQATAVALAAVGIDRARLHRDALLPSLQLLVRRGGA